MMLRNLILALLFLPFSIHAQFVTEKKVSDPDVDIDKQIMHISVIDGKTGQLTEADVRIEGLLRRSFTVESLIDTTFRIRTYRLFNISCVKEGYMYYAHKFWPDEKAKHEERIILKPLQVGLKTDVRDITFLGDKTEIYTKSTEALDEIIAFLELNPTVKLAVVGHVNGPDSKKSRNFYRKASLKRAESVVDYFVEHGIDENRLEAKGAGNTEMIYPDPITDWQSDANRRIEIEVVEM